MGVVRRRFFAPMSATDGESVFLNMGGTLACANGLLVFINAATAATLVLGGIGIVLYLAGRLMYHHRMKTDVAHLADLVHTGRLDINDVPESNQPAVAAEALRLLHEDR